MRRAIGKEEEDDEVMDYFNGIIYVLSDMLYEFDGLKYVCWPSL